MKRMKRILALVLTAALCLCLTGCQALEDMRAAHATWQEDDSILWNGYVYKLLPPIGDDWSVNSDETKEIYVTEPDVPVLLSQMMGSSFEATENELLLTGYDYSLLGGDSLSDSYYASELIFCRADHYDEVAGHLTGDWAPAVYGYDYYDWENDKTCRYNLTAEQRQVVDTVLTTIMPITMSDGMYISSEYSVGLQGYSEDDLFYQLLFYIEVAGDSYYLTVDDLYYPVPEQYVSVMTDILEAEIEANNYWIENW